MYFKIKIGYSPNDFISIDNLVDLEKAYQAFLTGNRVIFNNGRACRGQDIMSIQEDWHREMGWNKNYRDEEGNVKNYELSNDDWHDIKLRKIDKKYSGVLADVKSKVEYLIESGQENLIGKENVNIKLPEKPKELSEASKMLSEKMSL